MDWTGFRFFRLETFIRFSLAFHLFSLAFSSVLFNNAVPEKVRFEIGKENRNQIFENRKQNNSINSLAGRVVLQSPETMTVQHKTIRLHEELIISSTAVAKA